MSQSMVKVAAVQAAPVFLDLEGSLHKALGLIEKAAAEGARLLVFPEAFPPGPCWPGRWSARKASCTPPSTWTPPGLAAACSTRWATTTARTCSG
jgi:predicted amidohydrolase